MATSSRSRPQGRRWRVRSSAAASAATRTEVAAEGDYVTVRQFPISMMAYSPCVSNFGQVLGKTGMRCIYIAL
jgi:hypothetical protein